MIKIAICDDEIVAAEQLKHQIDLFFAADPTQYSTSLFSNGESLLQSLSCKNRDFDIIFLDIRMNRMNGMDAAKAIRHSGHEKVAIVFVTALKEYVFDAFDVNAAHYLLKPVSQEKLAALLGKIRSRLRLPGGRFLLLHKGQDLKKIPFHDILYCEVVNHRVFIYEQENTHIYGSRIDDLEKELDDSFFRCHRSFLVNLRYINSYRGGIAYLTSGEKIPVATRRQAAFMKAFLHYHRNGGN